MKNNSGITLLEILLAISLLTLILFAGGGVYLSGMNLFLSAQYSTQAWRNAQTVMMHMEKSICDAASSFRLLDSNRTLEFKTYNMVSPDFSNNPSVIRQYKFERAPSNRIIFTPDTSQPEVNTVIFNNIRNCTFSTFQMDGVVLRVTIEAEDNKGENTYVLNSCIEARFTASPAVYS